MSQNSSPSSYRYVAQHPKRKMIEVIATSSYEAAKVASSHWGMRNTSGISVTLIGSVEKPIAISTASL